jgi:hypothetical protein
MPDRSRCPKCGQRVSPYAAGCAVCGTDLDTRRWDSGPGPLQRVGDWISAFSFGPSVGGPWVWIGVLLFLAFGGTVIGALLGFFE